MKSKYYIVNGSGRDVGEGPWNAIYGEGGAKEFLENEVGAEGARIVAIEERPQEHVVEGLPYDVEVALHRVASDSGKSEEAVIKMALIDYLSRLSLLNKRNKVKA